MKTILMPQTCEICHKTFNSRLMSHVHKIHKLTTKEYYDKFLKQPTDGICCICNKETPFVRGAYNKCCSYSCASIYRQLQYNHSDDVKQFEIANNCTNIVSLRKIYGQGWYKAKIVPYIKANFQTEMFFVRNEDIGIIEDYCNKHKYNGKSHIEKSICKFLTLLNVQIEENNKSLIYPKELDIYLPEYNIAIEFNGLWYHSIEAGCTKEYHLQKSLLCRERGIRLIHIYEFENLDEQKQLLKELILGVDNYPKNDFNKNNLIINVPEPCVIYNGRYTIYGAGPLERSNAYESC